MDYSRFNLPACDIIPQFDAALRQRGAAVVTAPPGAGKSTLLPLVLLDAVPAGEKILMLEPRRIAARQIAHRMSAMLDEPLGATVGYRIRFESKVSSKTRIEVLTEGILARMIADDPFLEGVGVIVFDEFHERNLSSDVSLALVRYTRQYLRPDLRIVVMSATMDASLICQALDAPLVQSMGRCFPVEIINSADDIADTADISARVAACIRTAHAQHQGDILAFLPGEGEIRRCAEMLGTGLGATKVFPLYGMLPFEKQKEAIAPSAQGERRVVLATPVAETSLTIEGVRIVVDSGFCKKAVYDVQSGLGRLQTVRISMDMADQRSGRAGRVAPGVCYRLWSMATQSRMAAFRVPEILEAELGGVALDIAKWGEKTMPELPWITPPPAYPVRQAYELLDSLGAVKDGRITAHGLRLASFPCHPRIAQMLSLSADDAQRSLSADMAAILEEKDPLPQEAGADIVLRVNALRAERRRMNDGSRGGASRGWARILNGSRQYHALARCAEDNSPADAFAAGYLLALAYPQRIARLVNPGTATYQLSSGDMGQLDTSDAVSSAQWIVAASLNARKDGVGRIFLASMLDPADIAGLCSTRDNVGWDSRKGCVVAQRERRIGRLVIDSQPLHDISKEQIALVIASAAPKEGLGMFDFNDDVQNLQRRIAAARAWQPDLGLPDVSTPALLESAGEWLPLYLGNARSTAELKKIDLCQVIWGMLDYQMQRQVEAMAPSHIQVPTGSRIRVEYRQGADAPVLRVRLQECFGMTDTPRVNGGRTAVLMELLSPGFKPVQLTSDLSSFWKDTYFEVRKELRRRYPKHSWPDDPLLAPAVRGVKHK